MSTTTATRVRLARPGIADCPEFLELVEASRRLHRPWVYPPDTAVGFARFLEGLRAERNDGFFLKVRKTDAIAGVFVLSEIVRGVLQSAYLGFYAMAPHAAAGYMREGLRLVLRYTFNELRLHRVEAAVQPENERSINLVRGCGFRREGLSPRYLKIGGRWRDHERWAILADDWRTLRPKR